MRLLRRISRSQPIVATLESLTDHARSLLSADAAGLRLDPSLASISRSLRDVCTVSGLVCICAFGSEGAPRREICPNHTSSPYAVMASARLGDAGGDLGELWVARRDDRPFTPADEDALRTLADLAALALAHAHTAATEQRRAVETERERIAREMHDGLAQVLGVTHLRLRALSATVDAADADAVRAELDDLAALCHAGYQDVREGILALRESGHPDRTLLESLDAYVRAFGRTSGVRAELTVEGLGSPRLSPRREVQVIRIVQEALTNVRKHADAGRVRVRVRVGEDATTFTVEDDGAGFDPDALPADRQSFGLLTMRERSEQVSGRLTIDSALGRGTRVVLTLPHGWESAEEGVA
ncbi:sensor histidine kinase [Nigerium massiliense]|uniref:sensor histidine kinase n=1 Tax=Nigerium massiliense TaxID=1522317 RepID=UPI00138DE5C8|nr:ATP-binding protein [Nigerium massiliense]